MGECREPDLSKIQAQTETRALALYLCAVGASVDIRAMRRVLRARLLVNTNMYALRIQLIKAACIVRGDDRRNTVVASQGVIRTLCVGLGSRPKFVLMLIKLGWLTDRQTGLDRM